MTLDETITYVEQGGKVTCDCLPSGAVLKLQPFYKPAIRIVFEATGSGYMFTARDEHKQANWRKVEGWFNYV